MLILNIGTTVGLNKDGFIAIAILTPIIWVIAMLVESFIVGKISKKLAQPAGRGVMKLLHKHQNKKLSNGYDEGGLVNRVENNT